MVRNEIKKRKVPHVKVIPKRGLILGTFTKIVRWISALDAAFRKIPRLVLKPQWERTGHCLQCGTCCKLIGIEVEDRLAKWSPARGLIIWWVKTFNGFTYHSWDREHETLLFTCTYFKNGRCSDYENRSQMCKDYPPIRHYFKEPIFFPTCGYSAIKKK